MSINGMSEELHLLCDLTEEEFDERAAEFAKIDREIESAEDELKRQSAAARADIKDQKARKTELRRVVEARREERLVKCTWHADWQAKQMRLVRNDTGELVQERAMTAGELQMHFDMEGQPRSPDASEVVEAEIVTEESHQLGAGA